MGDINQKLALNLPMAAGNLHRYLLAGTPVRAEKPQPFNRIAYSAAHVVSNPLANISPTTECEIDWDSTIAYRKHLWSLGLGVAEAMDTAQRGMGLDWPTSLRLIQRSLDAARDFPDALVACGCGTDHLSPDDARTVADVIAAYELQMDAIERAGGRLIIMASRALARIAKGPPDYERVYDHLLRQAKQPVILHWLGEMFDPALAGYWGSKHVEGAMDTALGVIAANPDKVDGIKISLLEKHHEITMRRRLPTTGGRDGKGVRMYTGDDFNYPELIGGDGHGNARVRGQSDALLGIFDAIAPVASSALAHLAQGHAAQFHSLLEPTLPLARHMFSAPTRFYKTGVVFMAWLNGHQNHFSMVGGQQSSRSVLHLCELFRLADAANALTNPELAVHRMRQFLAVNGVS